MRKRPRYRVYFLDVNKKLHITDRFYESSYLSARARENESFIYYDLITGRILSSNDEFRVLTAIGAAGKSLPEGYSKK